MSDKSQPDNPADEIQPQNPPADAEMAKDKDLLSPEDGTNPKKGRSLLQVPSRSSSQRNQSSPTSTGLSGATVSDSRNSIGSRSKDSKGSFRGRRRNGSTSSNRTGGDTEPSNTPVNSQPTSPVSPPQKKKKSGGLLAFLGCCVTADSQNTTEETSDNVHKLEKLPQRPATAKSRTQTPQEQPRPSSEKEPQPPPTEEPKDEPASSGSTNEEPTVTERENRESKQSIPPAVTIEPPQTPAAEEEQQEEGKQAPPAETSDADMRDAPAVEAEGAPEATASAPAADEVTQTIPPPPPPPGPGPVPAGSTVYTEAGPSAPPPTKWLLPPIAPEHKGRKCLVLDLDETLVHSSFKVSRHDATPKWPCAN